MGNSGYPSCENLRYSEEKNIIRYLPGQRMESLWKGTDERPEFDRSQFQRDEVDDRYICPMGRFLPYKGLLRRKEKPDAKIYRGVDLGGCERRLECTKAQSRSASQDPREFLIERIRARLGTEEGKTTYGKRKYIVGSIFGDMNFNRKIRGLLLRGKPKARREFLIMGTAHNLRRIAKYLSNIPPEPESRHFIS